MNTNPITNGDTPRAVVRATECPTTFELEKIRNAKPTASNMIPRIMLNMDNKSYLGGFYLYLIPYLEDFSLTRDTNLNTSDVIIIVEENRKIRIQSRILRGTV